MTSQAFMPALTLREPWATAVAWLGKRVENRDWTPPDMLSRFRLAIHAGKAFGPSEVADARRVNALLADEGVDLQVAEAGEGYVLGAIVATCQVIGYVDARGARPQAFTPARRELIDVGATIASPWWAGPVGWVLTDVRRLRTPVPCVGRQKVWQVPTNLVPEVLRREEPAPDWPVRPPVRTGRPADEPTGRAGGRR